MRSQDLEELRNRLTRAKTDSEKQIYLSQIENVTKIIENDKKNLEDNKRRLKEAIETYNREQEQLENMKEKIASAK